MGWIEANGAVLRYRIEGDRGPWLVLLHELGNTLESWDYAAPLLARDRRILRYDWRGAGLSEKISGDITMEMMTDDLAALLDALGIGETVAIAGCSLGGAVSLGFAGRFRERVHAAIAMSPSIGIDPARIAARSAALDELLVTGMRGRPDDVSRSYPKNLQVMAPDRFQAYQAGKLTNDPESFRALARMAMFADIRKYLDAIACPVLGIGGEFDQIRPPKMTREIVEGLQHGRFLALPSGHYMPIQTPEAVAGAMASFLDEVEATVPALTSRF